MDETPEQRVERVLDKLRQNPRVTIIEDYDEVEDDAIVEADITLLGSKSLDKSTENG
jgi:hypothetical protein